MFEKLRTHILPHLIPQNAKVLVAVSGGPDSMALSHILWRYTCEEREKGISIVLTHIHHGVRKESDDEARMVQRMASEWKVPCIVHRFDSKAYAKARGQSFQEAAREWRYERWREDMQQKGCTLLSTAHHLGDQAETILYRLLRGSGTSGLAGIYPAKGSIIRPLLTFSKENILDYCAREDLPYALDRSNEEPVYVRNRIRLELLPELEKDYNPRIKEVLGRTGELLRWDEEYITEQVEKLWKNYQLNDSDSGIVGLKLGIFTEPAAILSRLLRKAAMLVTNEPRGLGFGYIAKIMESQGKVGWMQDLPGMTVKITDEGVWFTTITYHSVKTNEVTIFGKLITNGTFPEITLDMGRWFELTGLKMVIGLFGESEYSLMRESWDEYETRVAVFDKVLLMLYLQRLVCRTRRQGDRMWFQGVGHKSIKKVFQEENIPVRVRNQLPLIAYENEVLWIPGVRQSDLCRSGENLEKVYGIVKSQD
ncbi:MAG: tRNA lysidine(34) synthetase TilS [Bacillota bacterium]|nr:tRNA lysidine(34) synthetase TilS [Bacillota bacterium]MDP4158675.1 tRNA lysidine(34) synthetase TilS [Bacillota bacterium]